jgi:hypothetical protein
VRGFCILGAAILTVSNTTNVVQYTGNGSTVNWPTGFRFFKNTDLVVTKRSVAGVTTALTLNTDYSVSGANDLQGGTVTTTNALAAGELLTIARVLTVQQLTDLRNQGDYFAEIHEDVFDYLTMLVQQVTEGDSRALKHPRDYEHYQAEARRIENLEDPVNSQDAATKNWAQQYIASILATGQGPINNAANILFVGWDGTVTTVQALSGQNGAGLLGWKGRPISDALMVLPEHYGAKGDGVTDDSVAYQLALNSLPEYGTLHHKAGSTYRLVNGVDINKKGTTIVGYSGKIIYPKSTATFYHCYRVNVSDVSLIGLEIDSPVGLVRDDTGFAIRVDPVDNCLIHGCTIRRTASAAIWVTSATGTRVANNYIWYPLADGIHFSDGARNFVCDGNSITGTHDDAIAVVGDVPGDSSIPLQGTVTGNSIDGTVAGHGITLIACDGINVVANTMRSTAFAGIGCYFWHLTGAPVASDWANNCLIADNVIIAPGTAQLNENNNCGIYAGAFRNSTIRDNKIHGPSVETVSLSSGIRISACQGLTIEGNEIRDCLSYGVWSPDNNTNEAVNHAELTIHGNRFYNVAKEIVRVVTSAASVGDTIITQNRAYKCGYSSSVTNIVTVSKVGTNLLNMSGNTNVDGSKAFFFDPATCSNFRVADNAPEIPITYNPAAAASLGSWTTASSNGRFVDRGQLRFFRAQVTITTKGTGTGCRLNLPGSMRAGSPPFIITGKNTSNGISLSASLVTLSTVDIFTYNNTDPSTADGQVIDISGWFERA